MHRLSLILVPILQRLIWSTYNPNGFQPSDVDPA